MSIAVIIPARNAERVLPRTLAALNGAPEVLVVDNGSTDATAATALAHGAKVVHAPRPSRPGARNAGARATSADRLAFLDADCVPDPGWLAALDGALDDHDLVGGKVVVAGQGSRTERFDTLWRLRQQDTIAAGWSGSGNLAIRRDRFEALDGFDETFAHAGEDVDLCLRAGAIGYCPDAVVRHAPAGTLAQVLARAVRHGYGSTQLHHRHRGRIGRQDWKHPRPILAGDWALRRFGIEAERDLLWLARADYAGRVAGSTWAELRRAR
jgi:glycosyltransferase involved in cell wall biosynthesis